MTSGAPTRSDGPAISRRSFFHQLLAVVSTAVCTVAPLALGIAAWCFPLKRKRTVDAGGFTRVARLDEVPTDRAVLFDVIAERKDAWTHHGAQRIGSVFLQRSGEREVRCFSSVCPHLGCLVEYNGAKREFDCPCHNSSFSLEGRREESSPSARDLDPLDVDGERLLRGEVWVKYEKFQSNVPDRRPAT